jgi:hypothetical protein
MKLHKIFNFFFVVCLAFILASAPLMTAHAATVINAGIGDQPPVDWNQVLSQILTAIIPILGAALTAQAIANFRYWNNRLKVERPDLMDAFERAAAYAVPIVEQLKKTGVIPDNKEALEEAKKLAEGWLEVTGWNLNMIVPYLDLLEKSIEGQVNRMNENKTTVTLSPITENKTTISYEAQ